MGHPLHAPFTHFPLALWVAAFLGDLVHAGWGGEFWRAFSFWNIAFGMGFGIVTATTGFYDLMKIPDGKSGALRTGMFHMGAMLTAFCLFGASLYFHRETPAAEPWRPLPGLLLSGSGTLVLLFGGWLGGQLVYRHGVGYDR